ncbi:L-ascorbate metabolism protein UlaG (beta-lactamase superfamily) [Asanoa ferruginea]|uniref:L-ascorbate metabolism protein UlaG (Beta-lactamase superfamily) n=1 Tax=Asanoa ferruginea TaxID=53367 RepID=A0A3D9ZMB9_9ACTN|nr:MBL fold metallo-hydrolase [Asanoa ferruginea]REF97083.1 L-ascorbate metabolism protein UlaG (beta-lactamase superfamily) [Asanoa ferruginea]GIF50485.1 Zn-dependent hydrolase [Asanoa ferruginea]
MAKKSTWALGILGTAAAALAWAARDVPLQMGARPDERRVGPSPQWRDGKFHNRVPARTIAAPGGALLRSFLADRERRKPRLPIPLAHPSGATSEGLHITWYGHSSALVEIDGDRVLFDPVWSDRCSPSHLVGPRRLHEPPVPLDELPRLDAIVISHDHYDHLDLPTIRTLALSSTAPFVVPLGVGAHFARWGIPAERVIELDWDESITVAGLTLTATEARHFSGRGLTRDETLWASWVVAGHDRKVFYTGDSGYFDGYAEIGAAHGPFDVTLMQIGAYGEGWPDIHMTPEDAVRAHQAVRGGLMIPLHWGTFVLAFHDWAEPADRLWSEAKAEGVTLAVPRPGERVDVDAPPAIDGWWQAIA